MYESKLKSPQADTLYKAILSLKTVEECYQFFDDLCTINEINSMTQRYEVVKMLNEGTTFNAIAEATGASTATIARVNRCLQYGAGGYPLILERNSEPKD